MLYAIAILELILWHKYKTREKRRMKHSYPLIKPPKILINYKKINNQWRDKIKQFDFIKEQKNLKDTIW